MNYSNAVRRLVDLSPDRGHGALGLELTLSKRGKYILKEINKTMQIKTF